MARTRSPAAARRPAVPPPSRSVSAGQVIRHERALVAALLVLHAALATWVARENSVTFDESFHVPAGVRILRAADFATSYAQPPLAKTLYGAAALAAGARDPDSAQALPGSERFVGYSFMRRNEDRFGRVYGAARLVAVLMSLALAAMVWKTARSWSGPLAGLVALGLWVTLPETLAHAAVAGVDLPTALMFFGAALAWLRFVRLGSWRAWWLAALWVGAAFLTRFSAVQLLPAFLLLAALAAWRGEVADRRRIWIGLALLPVVALLALNAGYLFQTSLQPLSAFSFQSQSFQTLQRAAPWLRLPLPDAWLLGVDYLGFLAQPGVRQSYFLGQVRDHHVWSYFPVAIAVKWPVGFLLLIALQGFLRIRERASRPLSLEEGALLLPAAATLAACVATNLDFGVRYALPALPFLCVWVAGLVATSPDRPRPAPRKVALVVALVAAVAVESARALPHSLSFFNLLAGGPGRGDRIVNDSNVDWGQGLVALRRDLGRLGIGRVHLVYHGTVDPALYGIDYAIYAGGQPGPESDWLAVSSYFLVGLPARLTSRHGMSKDAVSYDLSGLRDRDAVSRPAGCMYLFRIR